MNIYINIFVNNFLWNFHWLVFGLAYKYDWSYHLIDVFNGETANADKLNNKKLFHLSFQSNMPRHKLGISYDNESI